MSGKQKTNLKSIFGIVAILLSIVFLLLLGYGWAKYIFSKQNDAELNFYEYRIQTSEISISPETYTGGEVIVTIATEKTGLSIQYKLQDSEEWIDYVGPFSVSENAKIDTRLVSQPDEFTGPITTKEIKNIAVAKIGNQYFKTLASAIDACPENAGDSKTVIEMLTNVEENVEIPEGKNIVLDLCGATIKNVSGNSNPTITVNGKLNLIDSAKNEDGTLQGEGEVCSTIAEAIKVTGNGNFVLGTNESGTSANEKVSITKPVVEGNTYGITVEETARLEFYDGKVSGKTNAINGNVAVTANNYEISATKENDFEIAILTQTVIITFNKNAEESVNITLEYETATKTIGNPIESLPTAQREGYIFVGWFTAKENGEQITPETIVKGTKTYYAIWESYTYTIEYNANGGSGTTSKTEAKYDKEATIANNGFTAPEGYTFKQWNTNAEGTGTAYNPADKVINLSNEQSAIITLYAIWEDTIPPSKTAPTGTGTTNSVIVNCNQTDAGSGIDEITVQYAIFKDGAWSAWQSSNIFENLLTNTEYQVKTQVTDKNGNGPIESEIGKISTTKIENGSVELHKENAQGEIVEPETSAENKENQINSNIYVAITPSPSGTTIVTVKTPDGQTKTYTEDTTIATGTGMYEITVETTDGTNTVRNTYYVHVDKTEPTSEPTVTKTTNTITVNANAEDKDSGIENVTYTIKKGDEIVQTNTTGEFTGLEDGIEYTVEITITDKAGNTITKTENVKTEELVAGSLEFTETTSGEKITPSSTSDQIVWVNENIEAVLTPGSTGLTTYEITAPDGTKTTYETDTQIATEEGNYVITLTTTDGTNTKTVQYYFSVDKTAPVVTINPNEKDYTLLVGENSLNLETTISVVENESGLAITKYAISTNNTEKPQDSEFKDFVSGSQITENLIGGEYYIWAIVQDNAGNIAKAENLTAIVSGKYNIGYTVEYNLNGGTGEFASFRKPHGQSVGLSTEKPTREMYIFKGWSELEDASEINYTIGGTYTKNESKILYAVWAEVVASTIIEDKTTLYESVQEAINAAGTTKGAVVTLLKDEIAESVTVAAGQDIVIDLNGKTWANTGAQTITNNGKLILKGDGKVTSSSTYTVCNNGTFEKYGNGTIEIESGMCALRNASIANLYEGSIISGNIGIENKEGAKLIVSEITIEAETYGIGNRSSLDSEEAGLNIISGNIISKTNMAIRNYSTGTVEINGGMISGVTGLSNEGNGIINNGLIQSKDNYGINNSGNLTITGGSIQAKYGFINVAGANIKMTGGEIISTRYSTNVGNFEITGGRILGETYAIVLKSEGPGVMTIGTKEDNPLVNITEPQIISGDSHWVIYSEENTTVNFYDGIMKRKGEKTTISQYGFADVPTGYRIAYGTETIEGEQYTTAYLDNTYYITFNENYENAPTTTKDIKYNTAIGELPMPTRENYIFDGWYTAQTDGEKITPETIIKADTTFYAHWLEVVASTTIGDVTTNYASVQGSIDAAGTNAGATVTLLKDEITESVTIAVEQDIILNTNGKTLTNTTTNTIKTLGKLTITGEGIINGATDTILNEGTENLTILSGAINTSGECAIKGTGSGKIIIGTEGNESITNPSIIGAVRGQPADIYVHSGIITATTGKVISCRNNITITGGYIKSSVNDYIVIGSTSNSVITIKGGVIEQAGKAEAVTTGNETEAKIIISGGKIIGNSFAAVNNKRGETIITGGEIAGENGIRSENGITKVSGGTITGINYGIYTLTGNVEISGTAEITGQVGVYITDTGNVTVRENPVITGTSYMAIRITTGIGKITGGIIKGETYGVNAETGSVTIGDNSNEVSITTPKIQGKKSGIIVNSNIKGFNFYDGIIIGKDSISGIEEPTTVPDGYCIVNGTEIIDGLEYETSYLGLKNYEVTEGAILADVVQVGDYINYDASSNGVKTFTSSECLAGSSISDTISTANSFNSSVPAQWRVLSVDKETGVVELMAADPTAQTVTLTGGDGFVNAETVLNNIGSIYGSGKGATGGRSINIEDIEQYSSFDKTKYEGEYSIYGGTKDFTKGYFYKEIKDEEGNVIGYETTTTQATSSNPVIMTQTHYTYTASSYFSNSTIHNMIFKNSTNMNSNKTSYWLASRCVNFAASDWGDFCRFDIRRIDNGVVRGYAVLNSGENASNLAQATVPVVTLQTNIKTTGKDTNGVWQLSFEEITSESKYYSTLQSAIEKASAGSTIKVLNGIEETKAPTVPIDKGLVLELNGKTTTLNGVSLINNGGLTITGEGKITSANADTIVNNGRLKKSGNGTIENTGTTGVAIKNTGIVNILEGTVISNSKAINTTSGIVALGANDGTVSTNNPILNGTDTGISIESGKFNFYDGAVKGTTGKSIVGTVNDIATNYAVVKSTENNIETSTLKQQYVINYDSQGQETAPGKQYKLHDENITISSDILTRDYYVFKGWATTPNATTPEYIPGATYTANVSATLYAVWVDAVASTTVGEKVIFYDTVQGAIDAGGTNVDATVTLLKDEILENVTIAQSQNITLDVNGKTMKNLAAEYTINNLGELTIIGEGTISGNASKATIKSNTTGKTVINGNCLIKGENWYPISNNNITIVNNGTILSDVSQGIHNYSTGNIEINGGLVQGATDGIYSEGNVTITGGIIKGKYGINNRDNANVKLTGGEIRSDGWTLNRGNFEMIGGILYGKSYAIVLGDDGTGVFTIGINEENPVIDKTKPIIMCDGYTWCIYNSNNAIVNFYDGIMKWKGDRLSQSAITNIPTGYQIVNGTETIDGEIYTTSYLAAENYEVTQETTLADVVQVGDYVNYDANSNGEKTFTSSECLAGSSISDTISTANSFNSEAPAQWRVLSADKESGVVELIAVDPTIQTVTLSGGDGFVNAETVLNNIGAIYGGGKGATSGRCITVEDIEQYSSYDKSTYECEYSSTGYYGGTKVYTSNKYDFYKEIKENGNVIGYETSLTTPSSSSPVTMTQTAYVYIAQSYFENSIIYNMMFKYSTNTSNNKLTYWLASRCVDLSSSVCDYSVRNVDNGNVSKERVYNSRGGFNPVASVVPVVSLKSNMQTTGQDGSGVWQLKLEQTQ